MGNSYITNPSAQQGEPENRKGAVRPADIPANADAPIHDDDLLAEGPTELPEHAQPVKPKGRIFAQSLSTADTVIIPGRKPQ